MSSIKTMYDRCIPKLTATEGLEMIKKELMPKWEKNNFIVCSLGDASKIYLFRDIIHKYKRFKFKKYWKEFSDKYVRYGTVYAYEIIPDIIPDEILLTELADKLLKHDTWKQYDNDPNIKKEFVYGFIVDQILLKYKRKRVKK